MNELLKQEFQIPTKIADIIVNYKKQLELIQICTKPLIFLADDYIYCHDTNIKIRSKLTTQVKWINLHYIGKNEEKLYKLMRKMYSYWIYTKFKNKDKQQINLALETLYYCCQTYPTMLWNFGNYEEIKNLIWKNENKGLEYLSPFLIIDKMMNLLKKIKRNFEKNNDATLVASLLQYFFLEDQYIYDMLLQR